DAELCCTRDGSVRAGSAWQCRGLGVRASSHDVADERSHWILLLRLRHHGLSNLDSDWAIELHFRQCDHGGRLRPDKPDDSRRLPRRRNLGSGGRSNDWASDANSSLRGCCAGGSYATRHGFQFFRRSLLDALPSDSRSIRPATDGRSNHHGNLPDEFLRDAASGWHRLHSCADDHGIWYLAGHQRCCSANCATRAIHDKHERDCGLYSANKRNGYVGISPEKRNVDSVLHDVQRADELHDQSRLSGFPNFGATDRKLAMRKTLLLLILLFPVILFAQGGTTVPPASGNFIGLTQYGSTVPANPCVPGSLYNLTTTNVLYSCPNGSWALLTGSGSSFTAGGDLSGSSSSQQVTGLLTHTLPALVYGYLNWNGSAWALTTPSGSGTVSNCGSAGNAYYSASGTTVVCDTSVTDNGSGTLSLAGIATTGV